MFQVAQFILTLCVIHISEQVFNTWMDHEGKVVADFWQSIIWIYIYKLTKLRGLSPRENYTDLATAACRRS
jgi:hypothetical protein